MKLAGLALATSLSSIWNCLHLVLAVRRRIGAFGMGLREWVFKVAFASAGMGGVAWGIWAAGIRWLSFTDLSQIAWLGLSVLVGIGSFFLFGFLLGIEEVTQLTQWIFRRK
jgi:peptidoglycan biosynthesis protein MviN/MurJ (putative lipid II flippase)